MNTPLFLVLFFSLFGTTFAERPNVVFILTDDQRADALSCMGHPHLKTPHIDRLAAEGALFKNHFCPTFKLLQKKRINSKYRKKYQAPRTPYQRLLESKQISEESKRQLQACHQDLNPFKLKQSIERKLKEIFKLVDIVPNGESGMRNSISERRQTTLSLIPYAVGTPINSLEDIDARGIHSDQIIASVVGGP